LKILLLDIETSPNTAYVWGLWNENIPLARLIDSSQVLCWAAKWHGESKIMFDSIHKSKHKNMIKGIHSLMDEADAIVHYNGSRFDIPTINKEFLLHKFSPPAPYKQIDLLQVARKQFRFTSNKLDYVAQKLGFGNKNETNFQLWVDCMNKNSAAWKIMEAYNKQDVLLLEKVYDHLKGWIKSHPNHNVYSANICCPNCGSRKLNKRGTVRSRVSVFQRYQCQSCGAWARSATKEKISTESLINI